MPEEAPIVLGGERERERHGTTRAESQTCDRREGIAGGVLTITNNWRQIMALGSK